MVEKNASFIPSIIDLINKGLKEEELFIIILVG